MLLPYFAGGTVTPFVHFMASLFAWIALAGVITSTAFTLMAIYAGLRFRGKKRTNSTKDNYVPPVSLLKPLHGGEPDLELRLASFFEQDYPSFEILFCARHETDAGLQTARAVAALYPNVPVQFLSCGEPPWPNARTYSLEMMRRVAKNEILVTADSDVLVGRDYLRAVVKPFADEKVGLVTCIYRGVARHGIWARLEALGMSIEMTSGVLVAEMLEGMHFALGPSMAMRQSTVSRIGGFAAVAEYYADDFVLGNWTARSGEEVVLSRYIVEHHVLNSSFFGSMAHQQGWATSTRFSRPIGHISSVLAIAMPFGCLGFLACLLLHRWGFAAALLGVAVVGRMVLCFFIARFIVEDKVAEADVWLYPIRDLIGFWFWTASFFRTRLKYRGEPYQLLPEGRLKKCIVEPGVDQVKI